MLSLAFCMEMQNAESVTVMKCYHQAEACAKQTANVKLQVSVSLRPPDSCPLAGKVLNFRSVSAAVVTLYRCYYCAQEVNKNNNDSKVYLYNA